MHKCLICHSEFANRESLHKHLRFVEKLKLESYYLDYVPRFDLYTKEYIKFKDVDQYLSGVFNTRANLVKYCKKYPENAAVAIIECIRTRSELKGLTRMLSTVEARSVVYPSKLLTDSLGLDWCGIGNNLGLECRYNYKEELEYNDVEGLCILCDTREQNELQFDKKIKVVKSALNFGDYSTSSAHFNNLFIERKSLNDAVNTLSKGYDRFRRELDRSREFEARAVILCEENFNNIFSIGYTPHTKKIKATPDFILHRMREIMNDYSNTQFLFVDGRKEAAEILVKLLLLKNDTSVCDLQYIYDSGNFF